MAEYSALTSAYDHARQAAQEFVQSHREAAANQHTAAARDFHRAARSTTDLEALRVLRLLEKQHHNLAQIIHDQDDDLLSLPTSATGQDRTTSTPPKLAITTHSDSPGEKTLSHDRGARLNQNMRSSSPSLARDIASRRGIPSSSTLASPTPARRNVSADSQKTSPLPRIPASIVESQSQSPRNDQKSPSDDDAFKAFYQSITTGTMSKLTSVLAFAGLPLNMEEPKEEPQTKRSRRTVKASTEPDVKKIFSKAALNALESEHRSRGMQGQAFGPTESFYVVQTSGGSLSYADIAKAQQTQSEIIGGDDEEAFVDASEAQPPSTKATRATTRGNFGNARTSEELELENTTLKQTLEQLALRLANFEAHAQDASMQALTQSVANLRPANLPDAASQERISLLEKRIEQQGEQKEKLEELARKQEKKIRAYHAKWEEIKKTAREKDKAKKEKQQLDDGQDAATGRDL